MAQFDRIISDPGILEGQPCIRGTRVTVRRLLSILGEYATRDEIRKDYPQISDEDIRQALDFAGANLADEVLATRVAK